MDDLPRHLKINESFLYTTFALSGPKLKRSSLYLKIHHEEND